MIYAHLGATFSVPATVPAVATGLLPKSNCTFARGCAGSVELALLVLVDANTEAEASIERLQNSGK